MSVVNRMLQDIDKRREAAPGDTSNIFQGTESVSGNASYRPRATRRNNGPWLGLVALGILGVAVWRFWPVADKPVVEVKAAVPVQAPAPPVVVPSNTVKPDVVAESAVVPQPPTAEQVAEIKPARVTPPISSETLKLSIKLSQLNAEQPVVRATPAPPPKAPEPAVVPTRDVVTITTVQPLAAVAEDTIRIARSQWAEGAKASALSTLREALTAAEAGRSARAIAPLAREIARLEIADNRGQVALDLLKRLETMLAEDADAWALRGNAEQRLGLHAEAADSYLASLRLRPGEAKWMLGAAISLAAIGKTDEARIWADRANDRGAVTPTIAGYLRQLGVATR